jgi:hypothetical protein
VQANRLLQAAELAKIFNPQDGLKIGRENALKQVPRWRYVYLVGD